ncbi:hypothetical protein WT88_29590 [Burkholderia stagnalis]|uniref:head-tail joining protein n=1 Tax=Burkholderia stagnalis TaxID=1503054 RepID=UPI0007583114|nr:hypothetical protein [Burkholderia stagnalis]KVZ18635.1 hypothetical protein WT35_04530 [Burkholderia stagnalis]KWN32858.1 hypothetical protein WT86_18655 [Burkholderia stagnalis]KWN44685.1 hypothetical protein WT88_29590 [Burkholderia stagnalis]KWN54418.1 hypothetical protein WT87_03685 [Burkholderia stagnalis]KWO68825.1 hypothetical protein WT99_21055 [Burkholderia stagnalis]
MIDFDALVNVAVADTFGEPMTYQPAGGGAPYMVSGVFAEPYRRQEFDGDGSAHWVTTAPSVGFRLSDLAATPATNDKIVRQKTGVVYRIVEPQPNGIGWINLTLKVSA